VFSVRIVKVIVVVNRKFNLQYFIQKGGGDSNIRLILLPFVERENVLHRNGEGLSGAWISKLLVSDGAVRVGND
jgi:hypothetical protein